MSQYGGWRGFETCEMSLTGLRYNQSPEMASKILKTILSWKTLSTFTIGLVLLTGEF